MFLILLTLAFTDEIPAIYKNSPHFSNAIGDNSVEINARANPSAVTFGTGFDYSIDIRNVRNPKDVRRPILEFKEFAVENLDTSVGKSGVDFRYRLRPRDEHVREIPAVRIDYYMPEAAEEHRLRTKYTPSIPVAILTKPDPSHLPYVVSGRLRSPASSADELWTPPLAAWLIAPIIAGSFTAFGISIWRQRNPLGAKMILLQRSRVVRSTCDQLRQAQNSMELMPIFQHYLQARLGWTAALTPDQYDAVLADRGCNGDLIDRVLGILYSADEARFGAGAVPNLAERMRDVILDWEANS